MQMAQGRGLTVALQPNDHCGAPVAEDEPECPIFAIVVLAAVKNGYALRDAAKELKKDREVVLAAVKNGYALRDVAEELWIPLEGPGGGARCRAARRGLDWGWV
jgi:hypothetical protein